MEPVHKHLVKNISDAKKKSSSIRVILEKDIQSILGISERVKAQRYKGRKIPGKYLTKNPGKMKKEMATLFR
mgnify:CR=1 FL=1